MDISPFLTSIRGIILVFEPQHRYKMLTGIPPRGL